MIAIGITLAVAAAAAAMLVYMISLSYSYRLDQQTIAFERLPAAFDGSTFLFISDVHRRVIPSTLIDAVLNASGADLVLIGGDLREQSVPLTRIRRNIKQLQRIAPVYMVYGNHDYDEDIRPYEVLLQEENLKLLHNESVVLEKRDGSRIRLAGVDDPRTSRDNVSAALAEAEDGRSRLFTILLAHDPVIAERLHDDQDIDLILAGHTHGGQISLPWIGPIWRGDNAGYWRGWYDLAGKATKARLFVSCGFGTSRLPIRLRTEAQLHLFILQCSKADPAADQS